MKRYYLQEVIGGWRLAAAFVGTYHECLEFMNKFVSNGNYQIVPEEHYSVDIP